MNVPSGLNNTNVNPFCAAQSVRRTHTVYIYIYIYIAMQVSVSVRKSVDTSLSRLTQGLRSHMTRHLLQFTPLLLLRKRNETMQNTKQDKSRMVVFFECTADSTVYAQFLDKEVNSWLSKYRTYLSKLDWIPPSHSCHVSYTEYYVAFGNPRSAFLKYIYIFRFLTEAPSAEN